MVYYRGVRLYCPEPLGVDMKKENDNIKNIEYDKKLEKKNKVKKKTDGTMKDKLNGYIPFYLRIPIYFVVITFPMVVWGYMQEVTYGAFLNIIFIIYFVIAIIVYNFGKSKYKQELINFAADYTQVQKKLIKGLDIPYGLLDKDGKFLWGNSALNDICKGITIKQISSVFPELDIESLKFEEGNDISNAYLTYESVFYRVELNKIKLEGDFTEESTNEDDTEYIIAMYMFDETEIKRLNKENVEQRMVAGLIYIDNYEDALESVEDVRQSLLVALIDRRINKYFSAYNAVVRKIEKDKYFIVMKQKYVSMLQSDKFSILDEVKAVNIGNEMAVTISIGFGVNGEEYTQCCDFSRIAIELALGRGGDQAVVKDGERIYFYGGKSKQVEKNTRVKARVKAHALREVLETKEKIVIMGHKIGDIDSLGASIGVYRAVKSINKSAYIILNEITSSVRPVIEIFQENEEYEGVFIKSDDAIDFVDSNTAVVVVDVSRPGYVECPEILSKAKEVVILDHHRRSSDVIENASLSYIEPYASSASEMVAEILQYFSDGIKIRNYEAEAMYAGIMIDTNNFTKNTGVRTFEAAAFLRKNGADVTHVRKLFRDSMDDYKAKARAISMAEVFGDVYSMTVCPSEGIESPTVLGAQIANELLNIRGIRASFVLTEYNNKVYVSARSMGDISVQLIMEKLGGGGHLDTAGAQLENMSISEAKNLIREIVLKMVEEKEV